MRYLTKLGGVRLALEPSRERLFAEPALDHVCVLRQVQRTPNLGVCSSLR